MSITRRIKFLNWQKLNLIVKIYEQNYFKSACKVFIVDFFPYVNVRPSGVIIQIFIGGFVHNNHEQGRYNKHGRKEMVFRN